jgi:hypothetical protein
VSVEGEPKSFLPPAAFIMIKIHIDNIDNIKLSNVILDMEKNYPRFQPIIPAHLGWRSKPDLDERFIEVLERVNKVLEPWDEDLKVECMWANVNREKDFNTSHNHKISIGSIGPVWSFTYYVKFQKDNGDLVFETERVVPEVGDLYIFPASIEHEVEPNLLKEPRISISGNVIKL